MKLPTSVALRTALVVGVALDALVTLLLMSEAGAEHLYGYGLGAMGELALCVGVYYGLYAHKPRYLLAYVAYSMFDIIWTSVYATPRIILADLTLLASLQRQEPPIHPQDIARAESQVRHWIWAGFWLLTAFIIAQGSVICLAVAVWRDEKRRCRTDQQASFGPLVEEEGAGESA